MKMLRGIKDDAQADALSDVFNLPSTVARNLFPLTLRIHRPTCAGLRLALRGFVCKFLPILLADDARARGRI